MKKRPILFSESMVRAILNDSKCQTRRVVNPYPPAQRTIIPYKPSSIVAQPDGTFAAWTDGRKVKEFSCPYGLPGDRLWVRETFYAFGRWETRFSQKKGRDEWHFVDMTLECGRSYAYVADGSHPLPMRGKRDAGVTPGWWKRPAIHMPRRASRLLLEIVSVRVERLQDISVEDCIAEGLTTALREHDAVVDLFDQWRSLWSGINGTESWGANPWVWCIEFEVVQP